MVVIVSACLGVEIGAACITALSWRATIDDVPIVILLASAGASAVGSFSWAAIIPFVSAFYEEQLISAFFTGSASGSLLAGGLGLLQGAWLAFGPRLLHLTLALLLMPSVGAWMWILRHVPLRAGTGEAAPKAHAAMPPLSRSALASEAQIARMCPPPDAEAASAAPTAPAMPTSPRVALRGTDCPEGGGGHGDGNRAGVVAAGPEVVSAASSACDEAGTAPDASRLGATAGGGALHAGVAAGGGWLAWLPRWLRLSLPMWLLAVPMNMATWGVSVFLVPFAAGHASCTCDADDPALVATLRWAYSLGFMSMPLAGALSYVYPTHSLRALTMLATLLGIAFAYLVLATANAPLAACATAARAVLVLAVVAMRFLDTYCTAMLTRLVAVRLGCLGDGPQRRATLCFGQMLVLSTLAASALTVALVDGNVIGCRATAPAPPPDGGARARPLPPFPSSHAAAYVRPPLPPAPPSAPSPSSPARCFT